VGGDNSSGDLDIQMGMDALEDVVDLSQREGDGAGSDGGSSFDGGREGEYEESMHREEYNKSSEGEWRGVGVTASATQVHLQGLR
jgi:hypothetical protein